MTTLQKLERHTFAVQYNPNCKSPYLVRLLCPGQGVLDYRIHDGFGLSQAQLTQDILGFGQTLAAAGREALRNQKATAKKFLNGLNAKK